MIVEVVHRHPVVPAAAVLDVMIAHDPGASFVAGRLGTNDRLGLMSRRRRYAHVRSAGHVIGWIGGVALLLVLVLGAAVGLR